MANTASCCTCQAAGRLRISPLFESLDLDDLDRLAAAGTAVRYATGERVLGYNL